MALTQSFKQYVRGSRVQTVEELYNKGMAFSTNALQEGYCKELVNLDINNLGESLTPRPGLVPANFLVSDLTSFVDYTANRIFIKKLVTTNADTVDFKTIYLVGECSTEKVLDANIYRGVVFMALPTENTVDYGDYKACPVHTYQWVNDGFERYFINPESREMYGFTLNPSPITATHVGCVGLHGMYYYFSQDATGNVKFVRVTSTGAVVEDPYSPTPSERVTDGSNLLETDPFELPLCNILGTANRCLITGALLYDENDVPVAFAKRKQNLTLKIIYDVTNPTITVASKFKIKVAQLTTSLTDNSVALLDVSLADYVSGTTLLPIECSITVGNMDTVYVITASIDTGNAVYAPTSVMNTQILVTEDSNKLKALDVNYSVHKAEGLAYWNNQLFAYGVPEDKTLVFVGDTTRLSYFRNTQVLQFDEEVLYVEPLLDKLLVFTTSKLHTVTAGMGQTGESGFYLKCIQRNLHIAKADTRFIQGVKNMVFFKSGSYFYMVVPSLKSLTGELVIAPISKGIEPLLDNLKENIYNTFDKMYNYNKGLTLVHAHNFLDLEDIYNVLTFKFEGSDKYVNYCLIYNSVARHWRIYVIETSNILHTCDSDATQRNTYAMLVSNAANIAIGLFNFDKTELLDNVSLQLPRVPTPVVEQFPQTFSNYQFLDTGYRSLNADLKKRFRELQFKINNVDLKTLNFYTEFFVDGESRKEFYKYEIDRTAPLELDTQQVVNLFLSKTLIDPSTIVGGTVLDEWELNTSMFPAAHLWKIRVPISGKGYNPRLCLMSRNLSQFEILSQAFVYRTLNSR